MVEKLIFAKRFAGPRCIETGDLTDINPVQGLKKRKFEARCTGHPRLAPLGAIYKEYKQVMLLKGQKSGGLTSRDPVVAWIHRSKVIAATASNK
jgi:hypothetical protein